MSQAPQNADTSSSRASNATTTTPMTSTTTPETSWRPASSDVGWEYGICVDPTKKNVVNCTLCHKRVSTCGITRLKEHIAGFKGNVAPCKEAKDEDKAKCRQALLEGNKKKSALTVYDMGVRREVQLTRHGVDGDDDEDGEEKEDDDEVRITGAKKRKDIRGPMDRYASSIHPPTDVGKKRKQQVINDAFAKERTQDVHGYLARWVYENGIPFHALDNDSSRRFLEAVGQYGPGYKPPSQYELREPLLKREVERTKQALKSQEDEWAKHGCSVMTDAWSDGKRRSIMNLCVNCKEGTTFLSSKEASDDSHTGEYIFTYIKECIQEVGPQNVIQVVTDNASNNMAAAKKLKEEIPHIFWTSCATHTINLMLQGIGSLPKFQGVIEKAKAFTVFIYSHHKTLAMMRNCTKKKDIVRPGVTRFATSFLTLQSLNKKKHMLRLLFASKEWEDSKYSKTQKGKAAFATIMSTSFWNGVELCLKVFEPLVKVLRLVDGDSKPSMGFLYGELQLAKKEIKEVYNQEASYAPILEIIDTKARDRLDGPLHLAAYFFNPYYYFKDESICLNGDVMHACITCSERFYPNDEEAQSDLMNNELPKYRMKEGVFGKSLAKSGCAKKDFDPVAWWYTYGFDVPKLQRMAIRILSLTTSSSGCERNWSTFQGIHTKKRNRLDTSRMSKLVYVQFNAKIMNKNRRKEKGKEILLAKEAKEAQEWLVEANVIEDMEMHEEMSDVGSEIPPLSEIREVRELYENDFVSEDEDEDNGDVEVEFESDDERVYDV